MGEMKTFMHDFHLKGGPGVIIIAW